MANEDGFGVSSPGSAFGHRGYKKNKKHLYLESPRFLLRMPDTCYHRAPSGLVGQVLGHGG